MKLAVWIKKRGQESVVQEGVEMGDVEAEAAGIVFSNMLRTWDLEARNEEH